MGVFWASSLAEDNLDDNRLQKMQEYAFQLRHFKDTQSNMAQFLAQRLGVNDQTFPELLKPSLILQELSSKAKY